MIITSKQIILRTMDVPKFVQEVFNSQPVPENVDYVRHLKGLLEKKPFLTNVNWKNELFVLNANRKSADFEKYPALLQTNGIIMQVPEDYTEAPIIKAFSFNTIRDYNHETDNAEFVNNWDNYHIQPIVDGTVMRVWWYKNQWIVSTSKCIDSRDANWSNNQSFYDLFTEASNACELDYTKLNKEYCYNFILQHPANHMIIQYNEPRIVHLSTVDSNCSYVDEDVGITKVNFVNYANFDDFYKIITEQHEPEVITKDNLIGYLLSHKETGNKYKFESFNYCQAKELKGNVPNIKYRIMDIIKGDKTEAFLKYFPQYTNDVEYVQNHINNLVGYLYNQFKTNPYLNGVNTGLRDHTLREIYWINQEEKYMNYNRVKKYVYQLHSTRLGIMTGIPYYLHQKVHKGKRLNKPRAVYIQRPNKVLTATN